MFQEYYVFWIQFLQHFAYNIHIFKKYDKLVLTKYIQMLIFFKSTLVYILEFLKLISSEYSKRVLTGLCLCFY